MGNQSNPSFVVYKIVFNEFEPRPTAKAFVSALKTIPYPLYNPSSLSNPPDVAFNQLDPSLLCFNVPRASEPKPAAIHVPLSPLYATDRPVYLPAPSVKPPVLAFDQLYASTLYCIDDL